jgi:hypothetical protein
MVSANLYRIRFATGEDADALRDLAERESQQPLDGRVLVGNLDDTPAAAISLTDGRVIADSSRRADHLVSTLRMRARALWTYEATPSLPDRLRAAFAAYGGSAIALPAPVSRDARVEHEPIREAA